MRKMPPDRFEWCQAIINDRDGSMDIHVKWTYEEHSKVIHYTDEDMWGWKEGEVKRLVAELLGKKGDRSVADRVVVCKRSDGGRQ